MQDVKINTIEERDVLAQNFAGMISYYNSFDELTAHMHNKRIYKKQADELFEAKKEEYSELEKNLLIDYRQYLSEDISNRGKNIVDMITEFLKEGDYKIYLQMIPQNCRYSVFFALVLEQISKGSETSLKEIIDMYIERTENCTNEESLSLVEQSKRIAINRERELRHIYDKNNVSYIYRSFTDCLDEEPEVIKQEEIEFAEESTKTLKSKFKNLFKKD